MASPDHIDDISPGLARVLGGFGRSLITLGVLLLLFAGLQLWGTGVAEGRAQQDLEDRFADQLASRAASDAAGAAIPNPVLTIEPDQGADPLPDGAATEGGSEMLSGENVLDRESGSEVVDAVLAAELISPEPGDPVGVIEIPAIDLRKTIVEGTTRDVLRSGPGHYRSTPLPGRSGNTAIAATARPMGRRSSTSICSNPAMKFRSKPSRGPLPISSKPMTTAEAERSAT